jgi:cobalt-zinc-cadmium efflux system protein
VLVWSLIATSAFVVLEAAAGAQALVLAWFAVYLQGKPADESRTFGYHRAGVLAAFVNALVLMVLSVWMFYECWIRLMNPVVPDAGLMLWVAVAGIALNGGIMLALQRSGANDINLRGAFLHMMGDMFGAAAIVAGALTMRATGWTRLDPLLSIVISVLIIWTAWDITRESLNILLEGLPRGLKLQDVVEAVRDVDGVMDVHDLHIWSLGSSSHALSCHVLIDDMPPSQSDSILRRVQHILGGRFHIHHTTIQFEHASCEISGTGCVIPVDSHHHDAGHHHHVH